MQMKQSLIYPLYIYICTHLFQQVSTNEETIFHLDFNNGHFLFVTD